jgi:hypothetical protein
MAAAGSIGPSPLILSTAVTHWPRLRASSGGGVVLPRPASQPFGRHDDADLRIVGAAAPHKVLGFRVLLETINVMNFNIPGRTTEGTDPWAGRTAFWRYRRPRFVTVSLRQLFPQSGADNKSSLTP